MKSKSTLAKLKPAWASTGKTLRRIVLAFAAIAGTFGAAEAAPGDSIVISGRVFNDADGITNNGIIDGPAIGSVNGQPLYVYLIDNQDSLVGKTQVNDDGTFSLEAVSLRSYNVTLSSSNQTLGVRFPTLGLPIIWAPTAEGDTAYHSGDGTPDFTVSISSGVDKRIHFGIDRRPVGYDYTITDDRRDASGRNHITYLAFQGYDDEDGTYTPGMIGRSIDLFQASGGILYYNGVAITFTSANSASRISNFDTSKLRFQLLPWLPHQFRYSLVDDAGIPELVANEVLLAVALPVDLTKFEGRRQNGINILEWSTATESGNSGFVLERSVDGNVFQPVAEIKSKAPFGNSNTPNDYSYRDAITGDATAYFYRLRQTDLNGTVTYSKTVRLTAANTGTTGGGNQSPLSMYPNPSTGTLNLDWGTSAQAYTVLIRNSAGTVVMMRDIPGSNGTLHTGLDLSSLPSGNYFLTLRGGTEQVSRQISLMTR